MRISRRVLDEDEPDMKAAATGAVRRERRLHTDRVVSGPELALALSVFLACAVEAVEALTVVLAVGTVRSWRSALYGTGAAALALAALIAALGPALSAVPIGALRVIVGGLLLVFGLQWLRKAILRAAGRKAIHDETAAYARETEQARSAPRAPGSGRGRGRGRGRGPLDGYALAVSFKAVLLEGLEVVFIVLTFGANQHRVGLAAVAAAAAVASVAVLGVAVRAPLARVPENVMKFAVGVMLTAFGTFWSVEGAGAHWPGGDAAIPVLVAGAAAAALLLVQATRVRPA
jgi:uncharacterized membrane protein